jgi:hypothetical protein
MLRAKNSTKSHVKQVPLSYCLLMRNSSKFDLTKVKSSTSMRRRKKLQRLRLNEHRRDVSKAEAQSYGQTLACPKDSFIKKPERPALSVDVLERLDFLACLFGGNAIK